MVTVQAQTVIAERCLRCSAQMEWRHQTWQCPRCGLKLGCCEGEPQDACRKS
jgi:exosome complex RNA-binding protein Csl4